MKIIDNKNNILTVEFDLNDKIIKNTYGKGFHTENTYCLHHNENTGEWYLAYRIDLDYKNDIQLGSDILLLGNNEEEPIIKELSKRLMIFTSAVL